MKLLADEVGWGVSRIGADSVHASTMGAGVKIAIVDTGIDYTHTDLNDNYCGGYDFVNGDSDPMDDHWHGTHCAGIIAAEKNDMGILGVAPEADIYALKVLDSAGSGSLSNVVAAIDWAIDNNMQIVSMSLGTNSYSSSLETICNQAYASGILLVAAAGNDGNADGTGDCVDYPANYDSVIAVASVYSPDVRSGYSSTGPAVELAAPGATIYSTIPGNSYQYASGTSMACPHVAGTAALVWALNPSWDNEQVRTHMQETAEDLGVVGRDRDTWYGFGLVNASAAAINIPEVTPSEMFVDNINMSLQKSGTSTRALAAVNVIDITGAPVSGVTVTGSWSGLARNVVSGTTDSNGKVVLTSNWAKKVKQGTFTFTVNGMAKEGWIYTPTYPSASISIMR